MVHIAVKLLNESDELECNYDIHALYGTMHGIRHCYPEWDFFVNEACITTPINHKIWKQFHAKYDIDKKVVYVNDTDDVDILQNLLQNWLDAGKNNKAHHPSPSVSEQGEYIKLDGIDNIWKYIHTAYNESRFDAIAELKEEEEEEDDDDDGDHELAEDTNSKLQHHAHRKNSNLKTICSRSIAMKSTSKTLPFKLQRQINIKSLIHIDAVILPPFLSCILVHLLDDNIMLGTDIKWDERVDILRYCYEDWDNKIKECCASTPVDHEVWKTFLDYHTKYGKRMRRKGNVEILKFLWNKWMKLGNEYMTFFPSYPTSAEQHEYITLPVISVIWKDISMQQVMEHLKHILLHLPVI